MGLFKKLKKVFSGSSNPPKAPEPVPDNKVQPVSAPPPAAAPKPTEGQGINVSFQMPNLTEEQMEKVFGPVAQGASEAGMSVEDYMRQKNINSLNEPLDRLDENGDLPSGWLYYNQEILKKWEAPLDQYSYNVRNAKTVEEEITLLKEMISYYFTFKEEFYSKDDCFQKHFQEYLEHRDTVDGTDHEYIEPFGDRLAFLEENREVLAAHPEAFRTDYHNNGEKLIIYLCQNDGVLQKDIYANFHPGAKSIIQELLRNWEKAGTIQRTKQSGTYVLHVVNNPLLTQEDSEPEPSDDHPSPIPEQVNKPPKFEDLFPDGLPDKRMAAMQAENSIRILKDTGNILQKTKDPEVFFSRWALWEKQAIMLKYLSSVVSFNISPDRLLSVMSRDKQSVIFMLAVRCFHAADQKAEQLKTEKGKQNQYKKFYDSFQPYHRQMSKSNILYVEYQYRSHVSEWLS